LRCTVDPQLYARTTGPSSLPTRSAFTEWCEEQQIELFYIEPGKPDQNAFVERFNRTYRQEVLDAYLFDSLEQVREITESWIPEYNEERPHRGGRGFSDRGVSGFLPVQYSNRRTEIHEETKTQSFAGIQGTSGPGGYPG
jgi:transposase InsO family protein